MRGEGRRSRAWLTAIAVVVAAACGPRADSERDADGGGMEDGAEGTTQRASVGETTTNETDQEATSGETTGRGASSDTSSEDASSSTGGAIACDSQPWFHCSVSIPCSGPDNPCGKVSSFFDENGCPRRKCGEGDDPFWCPEGMRCHQSYAECGWCMEPDFVCADDRYQGETYCACSGTGICTAGRICVPADVYPEGYCDP